VASSLVFLLDPRLRRFVQQGEGQIRVPFQHRDQAPFDLRPEDFLLGVLLRAVGQRGVGEDSQSLETLDHLLRHHRRCSRALPSSTSSSSTTF
jgi:hypothetical protein